MVKVLIIGADGQHNLRTANRPVHPTRNISKNIWLFMTN
jgi:hypothetical protein